MKRSSATIVLALMPQISAFVYLPTLCSGPNSRRHTTATSLSSLSSFLSPDFARDAASIVLPSVASVHPIGVRNITSRGSGFVIDFPTSEGETRNIIHLLTAAHVASAGSKLTVSFQSEFQQQLSSDGLPATLIGRDTSADLALISVEVPDEAVLPEPLHFFDSSTSPDVGTLAFACGYPSLIDEAAFTMGIVCGTARSPWANYGNSDTNSNSSESAEDSSSLFQNVTFVVTDASMAPGMLGGPLSNANGEVIGMCALVRPDLRALGNYAVSTRACQEFLTRLKCDVAENTKPKGYRVVLFNDPMNKKERVEKILMNVAQLDEKAANSVMMDAHMTGRGAVKSFMIDDANGGKAANSLAEELCELMRREDVLVEVEEVL